MSDKPISVGDLVVVVRGHQCGIGKVFTVAALRLAPGDHYHCVICGERYIHQIGIEAERRTTEYGPIYYQLPRLRRIPPLAELEGQRTQEDLREPA